MYPKDIPPKLLGMLSVQPPNALLSMTCAKELMAFVRHIPMCALDGFPPAKEYIDLLPTDTVFLYCMTPKVLREKRLAERARITGRKWTPVGRSVRDAELTSLVRAVRRRFRIVVVRNDGRTVGEIVGTIFSSIMFDTGNVYDVEIVD